MRIAVLGAGIAGLVAACGLQQAGHEVTIYEKRAQPNADGAGLTLFGNAFAALNAVGLGELVRSISSNAIASMRAGQRDPAGRWLLTLPPSAVVSLHSVHRVTLHEALVGQLKPGTLQAASPAWVRADGSPRVSVGGQQQVFDLVIAADGLRSTSRRALGLDPGLTYAGFTAWRGITTSPVDLQGAAGETWGRGKIFGIVPLPDHRLYWFGTLNTSADTVFADDAKALHDTFGTWHDPIPTCLEATPAQNIIRHDIYDLAKPLTMFGRGRTVLLGDAAHAMTPNLGQGAGQGIEDAATLTLLLRNRSPGDVAAVLKSYNRLRRRRTATLWQQSRWMAKVAQASAPLTAGLRDLGMRMTPGRIVGALTGGMHSWSPPSVY